MIKANQVWRFGLTSCSRPSTFALHGTWPRQGLKPSNVCTSMDSCMKCKGTQRIERKLIELSLKVLVPAVHTSRFSSLNIFIGEPIEFKNFLWSYSFYDALEVWQAGCYFGAKALPTRHGCHEAIPNPGWSVRSTKCEWGKHMAIHLASPLSQANRSLFGHSTCEICSGLCRNPLTPKVPLQRCTNCKHYSFSW